jgi:GAF domain-containing protein
VTAETKAVRAASTLEKQNNYVFVPCDPLDAVRVLVKSLYEVMSSAYSGEWVDEKINFEVTFMTRSYLDQGITIAAWANSDGQSPRSLLARRSNPKLYDSTVTAELYRDEEIGRASPRIIEDTADPVYRYQAVYPNQKERIKSSIIWPILSDETRLLGTLVVHCDKPNFFLQKDERYWSQILSVFARRIALEKLRLDMSIYVHTDADRKIVSGEPVHLF